MIQTNIHRSVYSTWITEVVGISAHASRPVLLLLLLLLLLGINVKKKTRQTDRRTDTRALLYG